jgi:hypothetical protein
MRTAPVFTRDAFEVVGDSVLPQKALYGSIVEQHCPGFPVSIPSEQARVYVNMNSPFSTVVCGSQVRMYRVAA